MLTLIKKNGGILPDTCRKQFGPEGEAEWPVLLYQTQYRQVQVLYSTLYCTVYNGTCLFKHFCYMS